MKTKWFSASVHSNYKELREKLIDFQFSDELGWGFQVVKFSPDRLQARYSEKVKVSEVIVDPYGVENIIEYNKYVNFNFWLVPERNGNHILIIENPPRSIKSFINNVVKCTGSEFYVSSKNIKIENLADSFKLNFDVVSFRKAKLKGLSFSKYTSGNLEVESSKDALLDIKEVFLDASYRLDKAKLSLERSDFSYSIDITAGGSVIFDEEIFDDIVKTVNEI
ncbi:TPA: hypothetical protein L9M45_005060 [Klebsiella quasipneumoniae subsp. quasipneumoniae]|nr:hypothetical protein [Klebsiella quasipneumoniae subsp. quasipneumoniae]HBR1958224.1 hypothetical protein [Klebsiella quasipneumoniae subsp. quasipneumoniae]